MKQRALTGWITSGVALLLLGFACVDADIPNISNDLRDALEETYANGGASLAGSAGSVSVPTAGAAGAGGAGGSGGAAGALGDAGTPEPSGGAAGSSMVGEAGAGGEEDPGVVGGDGCDGFAILEANCATSGCHGQAGSTLGDFASSVEAARAYIGVEGTICAGEGPIIDTDDPGASVLVGKLTDDPPCGQPMPPVGGPLSDEDIACIEEWIGGL